MKMREVFIWAVLVCSEVLWWNGLEKNTKNVDHVCYFAPFRLAIAMCNYYLEIILNMCMGHSIGKNGECCFYLFNDGESAF
jgi:hypothetical protein